MESINGELRWYNGMSAADLTQVAWRKSRYSNSQGNCVELAKLPDDGGIAVRNSRFPAGPALVYTRDEVRALVLGVKAGDFDDMLA